MDRSESTSPQHPTPPSQPRRRFLDLFLTGGTFALIGAALYPVLRFVLPPKSSEAATTSVIAGQVGELKPGAGKVFRFGNKPGLLVLTAGGDYKAFSAVCPHLQCTVQYQSEKSQIWCACHNGTFNLNGQVIAGPPPKGLDEFKVDLRGTEIVVSKA
ncbi:MAG: Rieske 2Fe-2S domain-containing protein [Candidatus Latescibacteria bacterium]|nr:Rieske 2Fe-2S domain-containing protein [Candidatus Latescibacterota bacterium]